MLSVPQGLQDRLDDGVTTLAWCWRVERRDGAVFGFTDHDRVLVFDGLSYRPETGFSGSDLDARLGLESASSEVSGLFEDDAFTLTDLAAGLWDRAEVDLYRVDWRDVGLRVKTWRGELGAVTYDGVAYRAELNGFSLRLERSIGRIYSRHCDAEFGDSRCGINLQDPAFSAFGSVTSVLTGSIETSGLETYEDGWFSAGKLTWTSGANSGASQRVMRHSAGAASILVALSGVDGVNPGDTFEIVAGCDKLHASCRDKFANIVNFRGFSLMPGNDVLLASPGSEPVRDGGSRGRP
ncbi:DUF2163 domain-containing protein [Hyphobacterium sp.]|uniref:DUF2163 domain-containing protein n=1 Tax=Hyphobacterium sp. TaxID=2004662 RepID=UPI003B518D0F